MSNWIFVMTGNNADFLTRASSGKWPIFKRTVNRNELKKGDHVIFYLGGNNNKKIMGYALVDSGLNVNGDEFSIDLSDVVILDKPIRMSSIVESLMFVRNKKNWGAYMQGGVVRLPKIDYNTVIEKITN
jgi:hypothetical protein